MRADQLGGPPPAYLGVCVGASFLPYRVEVGHTSAELQGIVPWEWGLNCVDVRLLCGGRGGPLGSGELAAYRDNREGREGISHTKNNAPLSQHFSFQLCHA